QPLCQVGRAMIRGWLAGLILAFALAVAVGCGRRDGDSNGDKVVDVELMAFLSEARALHHQANLKEDSGALSGAAAAMERLISARRPHDGRPTPEVQEVLADAYARLAGIYLRQNALPRAAEATKSGLGFAPDPTYFRGHLLEVEGLIEESRSN